MFFSIKQVNVERTPKIYYIQWNGSHCKNILYRIREQQRQRHHQEQPASKHPPHPKSLTQKSHKLKSRPTLSAQPLNLSQVIILIVTFFNDRIKSGTKNKLIIPLIKFKFYFITVIINRYGFPCKITIFIQSFSSFSQYPPNLLW